LDCFLHFRDFNSYQIRYRDFSILRFPDLKTHVCVVIEIIDFLVVDLVKRSVKAITRLLSCNVHYRLEGSGKNTPLFAGQKVEKVLLALVG